MALLDDDAPQLQSYALRKLNGASGYKDVGNRSMLVVESFWHEMQDLNHQLACAIHDLRSVGTPASCM